MEILVFGTSLMWGQGLKESDKMHNVLVRKLKARHPEQTINVTSLAHSGASTGYLPDGTIDPKTEPLIDGEVPTHYPTILQEIASFDNLKRPAESIDLILLDAGINDVHIKSIINPLVTPHKISELVEQFCYEHLKMLVRELLRKFPRARIVIVGYYEFVTENSEHSYVRALLQAFGQVPGGFIMDGLLWMTSGLIRRRLLTNCDTFSDGSWSAFCRVADDLNREIASGDNKRVITARQQVGPENAAFASDPWLFGLNEDLSPEDPMAAERAKACRAAGDRAEPVFCRMASTAHPNPRGAQAFADAILIALES